jgi:hypothetical protein
MVPGEASEALAIDKNGVERPGQVGKVERLPPLVAAALGGEQDVGVAGVEVWRALGPFPGNLQALGARHVKQGFAIENKPCNQGGWAASLVLTAPRQLPNYKDRSKPASVHHLLHMMLG